MPSIRIELPDQAWVAPERLRRSKDRRIMIPPKAARAAESRETGRC